ncbi:MAG: PAC2 family protein [Nanoarchaeota archaeon]|nr:PAC2 family protein [Nanoarchaeota archaeon]
MSKKAIIAFPGVGNIGMIVADYMINNLPVKKIGRIKSDEFPAILLDSEENFRLPSINMYSVKNSDVIIFAGDAQPPTEKGVYKLSDELITKMKKLKIKQVISLGGIGTETEPKNPRVYVISNRSKNYRKFIKLGVEKANGNVNAVFGMTGIVFGKLSEHGIDTSILLAETGGQIEGGINGASKIIKVLSSYLKIKMDMNVKIQKRRHKNTVKETDKIHYIG